LSFVQILTLTVHYKAEEQKLNLNLELTGSRATPVMQIQSFKSLLETT